jgi:hypothetical protein
MSLPTTESARASPERADQAKGFAALSFRKSTWPKSDGLDRPLLETVRFTNGVPFDTLALAA